MQNLDGRLRALEQKQAPAVAYHFARQVGADTFEVDGQRYSEQELDELPGRVIVIRRREVTCEQRDS